MSPTAGALDWSTLADRVVPRLVQAGYGDLVEAVLVRNPARYLSTASQSANRGVREMLHSLLRSAGED